MININARDESFFVVDSETTDTTDTSVILDFSMVFVDMARIHDLHKEHQSVDNIKPLSFDKFIKLPFVHQLSVFPDIKEQREHGGTLLKETLEFWNKLRRDTDSNEFRSYIDKLFSKENKHSIKDTVEKIETFLDKHLNNIPRSTLSVDNVFFLERSGGFDTNKYYNLLGNAGFKSDYTRMKYYRRREVRTLISSNRYRMPNGFIQEGSTNWNGGIWEMISKSMDGDFTAHIAINDCLIDAYMIYLLKLTLDNFYL